MSAALVNPPQIEAVLTAEHLHARYAKKIARHVKAVLGQDDEHEDLVQEVLMSVIRGVETLRDPACLDAWVAQVTMNTLRSTMRHRRHRRHASLETVPEQLRPSFQIETDERDLASRAIRVMNRLPPPDRALLATYWFSPATLGTMAAAAGCSVITVRRRLSRARTRFKNLASRDPALAQCMNDGASQ